jgi:hypothetical protein
VKVSSCGVLLDLWVREGDGLLVGLAGGQAVVQAADEAVEQVALCGGVVVAGLSAAVVVGALDPVARTPTVWGQ